jgi:hypothetical protein
MSLFGFVCQACLVFGVAAMTVMPVGAAEPGGKALRHIVLYKFKAEITPAQVQEVVDAFSALPTKIDTIIGYEHGTNVSTENKSEGITHCFVVTFRDEQGRDAYLAHPAHQAYVNVVRDRREKVIVLDYWTSM